MNGLVIAVAVTAAGLAGPFFGIAGRQGGPPQPFDDDVTLPGKIPATPKSLTGGWHFGYLLPNAAFEGGEQSKATFTTVLFLREDGTYQLHYSAHWNLPTPVLVGKVPTTVGMENLKGRMVHETGKFSLSGEVLLLQPDTVEYAEMEGNRRMNQQTIANESHTLIVRLEKAKLSVAGRCASYQLDPVCRDTPIVWYPMKAQLGRRWLGGEPK